MGLPAALRAGCRSRCIHTHPLHPRVLEDPSSTEAKGCVPNQQLGDEILGPLGDVIPVLVWEFVLSLLDALEQVSLQRESTRRQLPCKGVRPSRTE